MKSNNVRSMLPNRVRRFRAGIGALPFCAAGLPFLLVSAPLANAQSTPVSRPVSTAPNLLRNADFASGADGWQSELAAGTARATLTVGQVGEQPSGVPGKPLHFDVTAIDDQKWHAQFLQMGLNLISNASYTLTFWAKSDRNRPLDVTTSEDRGDYRQIGLANRVALTPRWRQYTLAFTALDTPLNHGRLVFALGSALGPVDLAGVRLTSGMTPRVPGTNVLLNGDFQNGLNNWTLTADPDAVKTALISSGDGGAPVPPGIPDSALRLSNTKSGAQSWSAQIFQTGLALREGEPYTLAFWAKADRERPLTLGISVNSGDYHSLGIDGRVTVGTVWRRYALLFTGGHLAGNESPRLAFSFGDAAGTLDLAGVALRSGTAVAAPSSPVPASPTTRPANGGKADGSASRRNLKGHPLVGIWESFHRDVTLAGQTYERYRIYFGADGKGNLKISTASGPESGSGAVSNRPDLADKFAWEPAGSGPHIAIGKHVYTWTIASEGDRKKLTLKNYEGKTYVLYRL